MSMNEPTKGPTVTKSIRVRPEIKQKVEELFAESGLPTEGEFLEYMAQLVEMQQLKEGVAAGYRKLLEEREYHKRRDEEIFMMMIQSEAAARLELTQGHEAVLAERNAAFLAQEQTIADMTIEMKQLKDEGGRLSKENSDQAKQIAQYEDNTKKSNLLLEQYEEKNKALSAQLTDFQETMDENKELHRQVDELSRQAEKQTDQIASLEREQQRIEQQHAERIAQLEARHAEELERLKEKLDVQRERELVQARSEYQEKLEKVNAEATAKQQESTALITKLYEQINELREQLQTQGRSAASKGRGGDKQQQ
ncbi:hypothetical protein [Paenibacillus sp. Cedars]|uniref:hypothetical protein n=1 Tax=Paenibacillus sp. Cedars TaxID=1980674 RepID=UPI0011656A83|nr:hypothetical protein [Paenibacillus sp. Cedars]AWP25385.1 hypothetical protein B9D94_01430 [Paenibacillus sp. Cedars]